MSATPVVQVERVSKKFCRRLRYSLWYGLVDLAAELTARHRSGDLTLRYGEFLALDDVSFELRAGECVGLIGHNGAGKSTLLKMLNGLVRLDRGRITMRGRVGALIELGAGFSPVLTGRENIYINGAVLGFSKREIDARFDAIVDFAELRDAIDAPVQSYSSGMYVRLGFAVAAQLDPDIFLIDELLAVGDSAFRMKCLQHLLDGKNAGKTIVVVSHQMTDVSRICDRVVVLDGGKKICDGAVATGIAAYENLLAKPGQAARRRRSDSAAWIEKVELFDGAGHPCENFCSGDDLIAEITLGAKLKVSDARLTVQAMAPSLGELGAFAAPHSGLGVDIEAPATVLRLRMSKLPLLAGHYHLNLNLSGSAIDACFDALTDVARFTIAALPADSFGNGVCHGVNFEHDWEVVNFASAEKSRVAHWRR
jgi:lipopolysaccharide transport system ATP-binding protein